jgi:2-iminobutanoate/2-iminopropanoate deaminase
VNRIASFFLISALACAPRSPEATAVVPALSASANYTPAMAAGGLVFLSGVVGMDPATKTIVPGGIAAETQRALDTIASTLDRAGSTRGDVATCTVYLRDMNDYEPMNQVWRPFWGERPPARTTVQAQPPLGAAVEITCVAVQAGDPPKSEFAPPPPPPEAPPPEAPPPQPLRSHAVAEAGCAIGGCRGEVCYEAPTEPGMGIGSACMVAPSDACYQTAECKRQADGNCGWTEDTYLLACLREPDGDR